CFLGRQPRADILNALSAARVPHHACESLPAKGPGIIFFDEITKELSDTLRAASCSGTERVLAIGLSQSTMKSAGIWSLLDAGASDVFAWDHSLEPAREVAARFERWDKVDEIVRSPLVKKNLAGQSAVWIRSLR